MQTVGLSTINTFWNLRRRMWTHSNESTHRADYVLCQSEWFPFVHEYRILEEVPLALLEEFITKRSRVPKTKNRGMRENCTSSIKKAPRVAKEVCSAFVQTLPMPLAADVEEHQE